MGLLELAKAIEYLYSKRVVHGNIRAQSAIISAKDHILLYDFGFANLVASKVIAVTPSQPTPELYPPEVWDGGPRTYGSDVYSFGMTIYQVLSGEDPSSKYEETGMIATVISGERPPRTPSASPDGMSYDHLWQVAEECWQGCPNDRPAISTVRQWLTSPFGQPSSRKEITLRREKRGAARVTGRVAPILEESTESRSAPFGQPRHGSKSKFQDGAGRSVGDQLLVFFVTYDRVLVLQKSGPDVLSAGRPGETLPRETVTVTLDDSSTVETVLHPVDVGGFSDIFEGYQYRGSCKVALKRSRIAGESSSRIAEAMEREAAIWYEARDHPHVLPFLGRGHDGKGLLYLVSPYMANGNLWTYVQSGISMGEERDCPKYLKEIASALGFVHSKEIIHGDVKALNILISTDDHAYLCDFGSALGISQARLPASRTPRHMSPELWSGNSNTKSSDVYAFGITIYEVLSGEIPFNDTWDESALQRFILQGNRPPSHPADSPSGIDYSPLWDIAKRCWRAEANNRPTMQTVYGDLRAAMLTPGGLEPHSKT
ncbi:hypothetical protein FRB99_003339 [Tulasnella sp. 403]|nr:hypothetical protein FRB99_003339 [Tulasnella sp. 403]